VIHILFDTLPCYRTTGCSCAHLHCWDCAIATFLGYCPLYLGPYTFPRLLGLLRLYIYLDCCCHTHVTCLLFLVDYGCYLPPHSTFLHCCCCSTHTHLRYTPHLTGYHVHCPHRYIGPAIVIPHSYDLRCCLIPYPFTCSPFVTILRTPTPPVTGPYITLHIPLTMGSPLYPSGYYSIGTVIYYLTLF